MSEKPFNQLTSAQAERLALLLEELGEAQQAIGKILRHGYESHHPRKPKVSNRDALEREIGDVMAAVFLMECENDVHPMSIKDRTSDKLHSVGKYLHYEHKGISK